MTTLNKYISNGFRAVHAGSMSDAAKTFALRLARRDYGKRGTVRILNCNAWSQDHSFCEYSAFIGYRTDPHTTTGHNVYFTVSRA